ncbi:MAG: zinc-dependent metalloprotease [Bacteroidetes bacterium]|nr:zinc-dependent metalloprotease [Bacteroidota bacterium]
MFLLIFLPMFTSNAQWNYGIPPEELAAIDNPCAHKDEFFAHADTAMLGPVAVRLHVIRRSDGTTKSTYDSLTRSNLLRSCDTVKSIFERDARIQLHFDTTINYIDSDSIFNIFPKEPAKLYEVAKLAMQYKSPNTVDIFIADNMTTSGNLFIQGAPFGACIVSVQHLYTPGYGVHGKIMAHEMGHAFGLYHTHESQSSIEHISRTTLDAFGDSLCYSTGDHCCDTPAEPATDLNIFHPDCSIDTTGGLENLTDPAGVRYVDADPELQPDVRNIMGYGRTPECIVGFSPQQAMIMRCTYRSWPEQYFVRFAARNRTQEVDNIGGDMVVFPPRQQLGANLWLHVNSGDTLQILAGADHLKVMARDTMTFDAAIHRSFYWAQDKWDTDLARYWNYDTTKQEEYNNDACAALFKTIADSVTFVGTVDGIEVDGLPARLFDPWKPRDPSHWNYVGFPNNRFRYSATWYTDTLKYDSHTPFQPNIGVFMDQEPDPDPFSENRNTFYRLAAPLAVDGVTGKEFDPLSGGPPVVGDVFFLDWSSSTTEQTYYYEELDSPWRTASLRFTEEDQRLDLAYKGHLLGTSKPSTNSQRKLVHDGKRYCFLYESDNRSWITMSENAQSGSWSMEREIIGFPSGATASLDARDDLVLATAAAGQQWSVTFIDPLFVDQMHHIDIPVDPDETVTDAVIAKQSGAPHIVTVAARSNVQTGDYDLAVAVLESTGGGDDYTFHTMTTLPPAYGLQPRTPTLACDESGAFHLAWEEDNRIFYTRFLVDANGNIDSVFSLYPDQLPVCSILDHGSNPSIAVDAFNRPHVAWQSTLHEMDEAGSWSAFQSSAFGQVIAHRYKLRPYSDAGSSKSWSRETIFAIEGRDSRDPVTGCDRIEASKIGISWWSEEDSGRVHVALAEHDHGGIQSWKRKTLDTVAAAPHFAIRESGPPLLAFSRTGLRFGAEFDEMHFVSDEAQVDFEIGQALSPMEFRGATVRNEAFTASVYFHAYEDSVSDGSIPFVPACDTLKTELYPQIPGVVRTETAEVSDLFFDIRRRVYGITPAADPGVFDSTTVSWWAVIRNAVNDTVVCAAKLGELARDSVFTGVDSMRVSFPLQEVYSELVVETSIAVFPCVEWGRRIGIPRDEREYSTQKTQRQKHILPPDNVILHQAAPNPFQGRTMLAYTLGEPAPIRLSIHDVLGRLVTVLVDAHEDSGYHSIVFDGSGLRNGIYFIRLQSDDLLLTGTIHLLR